MTSDKHRLRATHREQRAARSATEAAEEGRRLLGHLLAGLNERDIRTVAGYVPVGSEPGVGVDLVDRLADAGVAVLLPVALPSRDLAWGRYDGPSSLVAGPYGLSEPDGPRGKLEDVELVLVPALGVGRDGTRLGRGAGYYDRALAQVAPGVPLVAMVYDDELVASVPTEPHDRPVTEVITPRGGWMVI